MKTLQDENYNTNKTILICAFRYALGRQTYVVSIVVEEIHRVWSELNHSDKELIVREILEQQRKSSLGHRCDEDDWLSIVKRFNAGDNNEME